MDLIAVLIWIGAALAAGAAAGAVFTWLFFRPRQAAAEARLAELKARLAEKAAVAEDLSQRIEELGQRAAAGELEKARLETTLAHERQAGAEKLAHAANTEERLKGEFASLAAGVLKNSNEAFLNLARSELGKARGEAAGELEKRKEAIEGLVKPLAESLRTVSDHIGELERRRGRDYGSLTEMVKMLEASNKGLASQTASLANALKAPQVRGAWGEMQLKRVVEMAGMTNRCDFSEQESISCGPAGQLRPDMVVHLPGGRNIVIDAKTPLSAYLEAVNAETEEERRALTLKHAAQVRTQIKMLSSKNYWAQFQPSPEFVVMFLPGEAIFSLALSVAPGLIEEGAHAHVVLATPTTLIALLRAVSYGWQQEEMAKSVEQVGRQGKELYERIVTFMGHLGRVGKGLDSALNAYNNAVGSLEARLLPAAREFRQGPIAAKGELAEPKTIKEGVRAIQAPELAD